MHRGEQKQKVTGVFELPHILETCLSKGDS